MRPFAFHTLDVFTTRRFAGNPLAVVLKADGLDGGAMQALAREFNLSETIFVRAPDEAGHEASVRIFTPGGELPFAGHPIVGCAILLAERHWPRGPIDEVLVLKTPAGPVPVRIHRAGGAPEATLTVPIVPTPRGEPLDSATIAHAVGLGTDDVLAGHPVAVHEGGPRFTYLPLRSLDALARARAPVPGALESLGAAQSIYCYAPGEEACDWRARMFAPDAGIPEDAATGSASAILASQLLAAGALAEGTTTLALRQGVEMGRPSEIRVEVDVEGGSLRAVRVTGSAVRVSDGQVFV